MKKNTDFSAARIALAMFAGLAAGVAVAATGVPVVGHIADAVVFTAVLLWPRRASR